MHRFWESGHRQDLSQEHGLACDTQPAHAVELQGLGPSMLAAHLALPSSSSLWNLGPELWYRELPEGLSCPGADPGGALGRLLLLSHKGRAPQNTVRVEEKPSQKNGQFREAQLYL